ncbi:MBL fold metallo-hydrolase [Paenibacillus sp. sgz302251]|uniref:MBL fold metallo-hydrolase n=1 Tax=Paenibacillus sp. sgz302251 TaxID=3414493 RepID=UPI003C7E5086
MLVIISTILAVIVVAAYAVLRYYPPLGAPQSKERRQQLSLSKQYGSGKFAYPIPTPMGMSIKETLKLLLQFIRGNPHAKPSGPVAVEPLNVSLFRESQQHPRVTWFGHSAALLQLNSLTLLLDPMFGRAPSPFPGIGGKRFSDKLPMEIEQLPDIDAVFISHDHYDHLDYGSILRLKSKVKRYIVPLGVAPHLVRWGIDPARIEEHDWWEEFEYEGLRLACTPARHFSGRSLTDRDATLWCSWVIQGRGTKVFFSGDSGYGPHFKEIGSKYGPFDLTLMECGQYDRRWAAIHMMPEETVQAHLDVQGRVMIPIHWGAFTLAMHSWTDPVERAVAAAKQLNATISTPKIGEPVLIGSDIYPVSTWWK